MEPKNVRIWIVVAFVALAVAGGFFIFGTRRGASARQAVDHVTDELTGKRAVDQGAEVRTELRQITEKRNEETKALLER